MWLKVTGMDVSLQLILQIQFMVLKLWRFSGTVSSRPPSCHQSCGYWSALWSFRRPKIHPECGDDGDLPGGRSSRPIFAWKMALNYSLLSSLRLGRCPRVPCIIEWWKKREKLIEMERTTSGESVNVWTESTDDGTKWAGVQGVGRTMFLRSAFMQWSASILKVDSLTLISCSRSNFDWRRRRNDASAYFVVVRKRKVNNFKLRISK